MSIFDTTLNMGFTFIRRCGLLHRRASLITRSASGDHMAAEAPSKSLDIQHLWHQKTPATRHVINNRMM